MAVMYWLALAVAAFAVVQDGEPQGTYEWLGDCPAACCGYAEPWTAADDVPAWRARPAPGDTPGGAPAFVVRRGETVRAVTGSLQVLARGRAVMREDFSTDASYANLSARHRQTITLLAGDDVHLLAPRGGDAWRIWHRGRILDAQLHRVGREDACRAAEASCAGVIVLEPVTRWWVMVAGANGEVGWVDAAGRFDGPACR